MQAAEQASAGDAKDFTEGKTKNNKNNDVDLRCLNLLLLSCPSYVAKAINFLRGPRMHSLPAGVPNVSA